MKKVLVILISMLLIISFLFMVIPIGLSYIFSPLGRSSFITKSPTFEENPSLFYDSFITNAHNPILVKEEELLFLYGDIQNKNDANTRLEEMVLDLNLINQTPRYNHDHFQPLYDANALIKESLLNLIRESQKPEILSSDLVFNAETLRSFYEAYLTKKENLYLVTIETFTDQDIVFFLEDDGTITVYDP